MRRMFVFLLLATNLAGFTRIADAQDCIAQVWKGTIGEVPVMMEFDYEGEDAALVGRYYYRTSLVDLLLMSDGTNPGRWKELDPKGKVSGYLTLSCKEKALSGSWSSPDGSKTLPVSAEVQPADSFSKQRLDSLKPTAAKRESIGKFQYELFTAPGFHDVKGLRLIGDGKAVADINSLLMTNFRNDLDEAITCKALGLLRLGQGNGYSIESEMSMIAWNQAFVVIGRNYSSVCGQVHPMYDTGAVAYNLQTGKTEDVSQWLIEKYRDDIPADSPLGKIIMKFYPQADDCADSVTWSGEGLWPTSTGITFLPSAPYANIGCVEGADVPYKNLSAYLSPLGKTNVQAFRNR